MNYDVAIDTVGNDEAGEMFKTATALDVISGGHLKNKMDSIKDGIKNSRHKKEGHVQGKNGDWYDPNKRGTGGVDEYLDTHRGSKSK